MISCPKCKSKEIDHIRGDECNICGYHACTYECENCHWKGTLADLQNDIVDPKPREKWE